MDSARPLIYRYWGKAQRPTQQKQDSESASDQIAGDKYHLLVYHCLDVAACGHVLLSDQYPWAKNIANRLDLPVEQFRRIFVFFLLLHDIGKFSRAFQGLAPGLSPDLVPAVPGMTYSERHDSLGYWLWLDSDEFRSVLAESLDVELKELRRMRQLNIWFELVTGHHGQPPEKSSKPLSFYFTDEDIEACTQFLRQAVDVWLTAEDVLWLKDKNNRKKVKSVSWQLAGITVLADWTGSNQNYFAFNSEPMPLSEYWQDALKQAEVACQSHQLQQSGIDQFKSVQQLFDFIEQPTPLQQYAIDVPLCQEPQLFLLEDVTGAGKTEAAMVLVHRLMSAQMARGFYIGLPTMATANGMYERMKDCYQQLYSGQHASLVLAHGARHLSESFTESIGLKEQQEDQSYDSKDWSASAYCNIWLADSRKKSLLADVGVGTIDQALLSVLPSRHQSLRVLGLLGKVLLVDEVHAYDSYMQELLASLLEMHARQGGSAILLSATLPQSIKNKLVMAYAKGRGKDKPVLDNNSYPLATQFPSQNQCQQPLATRKEVERTVKVERLADYDAVYQVIDEALQAGKSVCWIRSTVDNARESYQTLHKKFSDHQERIHLFHSRFAMIDRQRIEENVLRWFGKKSKAEIRKGRLLIATQVVEQSLDLDFDILITDLAPIDLLIQRAGRLHRHVRDKDGNPLPGGCTDQREAPVLYLLSPTPSDQAKACWLQHDECFKGSAAVYRNLGILWRSAKVLLDKGEYAMPADARYLIDSVYSGDDMLTTPSAIEEASFKAEGEEWAASGMAKLNLLDLDQGYSQDSSSVWTEEINVPTRLSDATENVVLVRRDSSGHWQPYAEDVSHAWDLSTVKIREKLWSEEVKELIPAALQAELERFQQEHKTLRWVKLFPLVDELQRLYSQEEGWGKSQND